MVNAPSLIWNNTGSVNLLSTGTYFVVNKQANLPYKLDTLSTIQNKDGNQIIQVIAGTGAVTLTGVNITNITTATGVSGMFTGALLASFGGNLPGIQTMILGIGNGNGNSGILSQTNPTNLSLLHVTRSNTFTFSWTAGSGNGGSCKLQYYKNATTWTDISATTYNCDTTLLNQSVTLPTDGWYTGNWNGAQIRTIRTSDSIALGTFPQTLLCAVTSGSVSSTPSIDEDCNGAWDNNTYINNPGWSTIIGTSVVNVYYSTISTGCAGWTW
jgi:hypothetical protein